MRKIIYILALIMMLYSCTKAEIKTEKEPQYFYRILHVEGTDTTFSEITH
jgi:hypothetical protein